MALIKCPECGEEVSDRNEKCIHCGYPLHEESTDNDDYERPKRKTKQKRKKQKNSTLSTVACVLSIFTFTFIFGIIVAIVDLVKNKNDGNKHTGSYFAIIWGVCCLMIFGFRGKTNSVEKVGETNTTEQTSATETESVDVQETSNVFKQGDVVETDTLRITFLSAGEYTSKNDLIQPKDGNVFYRATFEFENISDKDEYVSSMIDWECYADSYKVDQTFLISEDTLDATLSSGKKVKGSVFFEVPKDAKDVDLEYDINYWQSDHIVFKLK